MLGVKSLAWIERILLVGLVLLSVSADARGQDSTSQKPEDWERQLERLRSVPYVAVADSLVEESEAGVQLYDPDLAYDGYNLYCTMSSGEVFLLDMDGRVVHRWTYSPRRGSDSDYGVMLDNGDLVVIKKFQELMRLNWNSELIWTKELAAHHDVVPAPDGSFYVIVQERKNYRKLTVKFDAIVHVTADGREIGRWSTYDHLAEIKSALDTTSFLDNVLDKLRQRLRERRAQQNIKSDEAGQESQSRARGFNYFHLNTINVLPETVLGERDVRFQQGNLLVCFRNVNQIAVLEKDTHRILWAWGEGELEGPHHPTMLSDGHILIFDNGDRRMYSRIVELDPLAEAIVWEYKAKRPRDFFSPTRGSAQRLPNGNTLICESDRGRVFEVTMGGEVVWEWINVINYRKPIYRMLRQPTSLVDMLLNASR